MATGLVTSKVVENSAFTVEQTAIMSLGICRWLQEVHFLSAILEIWRMRSWDIHDPETCLKLSAPLHVYVSIA